MSSEFIGFRANYKKDSDILSALENAKDRTKELKRLIRLGIQASNSVLVVKDMPKEKVEEFKKEWKKVEPLDWRPTFEAAPKPDKKAAVANILGGFD